MAHRIRDKVKLGSKVKVTLKEHQGTDIMTEGNVAAILTNSAKHPRGIKVRLDDGQVGRVQFIMKSGDQSKFKSKKKEDAESKAPVFHQTPLTLGNILDSALETWSCKSCTYLNGVFSKKCEICGTLK